MAIEVVAALIRKNGKILVCQRAEGKKRELKWELAGGKIEKGETAFEAIVREIKEELGMSITPISVFGETTYAYPDVTIHLTVINASISEGEPQLMEHNAIAFVGVDEIGTIDLCPADREILENGLEREECTDCAVGRIRKKLFSMAEEGFSEFTLKLIPTIKAQNIIGIRTPILRSYAKELYGTADGEAFLNSLPHQYFEENNLHAFMLERVKEASKTMELLDEFLSYVDNWATCDQLSPKNLKKNPESTLKYVDKWLKSDDVYTVRFAVSVLMKNFLSEHFDEKFLTIVAAMRSKEYYVNMMRAWYFAEALVHQYDSAVKIIEAYAIDDWTHNKAIQKAIESRRIDNERKLYLRSLKVNSKIGK